MNTRRRFVHALGAIALAVTLRAAAQPSLPVVGFLSSRSPAESAHLVESFRKGLAEAGFVEGKNVAIDYRWAEGRYERLPEFAAELVRRNVGVIATAGGSVSALAAKAATSRIPIVFLSGGDVVKLGLVPSLSRPGGNVTGVSQFTLVLLPKRLELMRELLPKAVLIGVLVNPKNPNTNLALLQSAAKSLGLKLAILNASEEAGLEAGFAGFAQSRVSGVLIDTDPFFDGSRVKLIELAQKQSLPTIYGQRESALAGGLISYGPNFAETYREAGAYTGRILKGAKPGELPVLQPTKFEMVVNLKTAKALGITVAPTILVRADEVIQ